MRAGRYIAVVFIAGLLFAAFVFYTVPDAGSTQLPLVFAFIAGVVAVLAKMGDTDTKIEAAAAISQTNAVRLEVQADQLQKNTATTNLTHQIVNSQHDLLVSQLKAVELKLANLQASNATKATAQSNADATEARIITAIETGPTPTKETQ